MKTHKNPALREAAPQSSKSSPSPSTAAASAAKSDSKQQAAKPPRCVLEGKKWVVVSVPLIIL